tara:strand:+ start:1131 stop:1886 length:756 start_codon:yes stop_codon:yes gene_type:complete
MAPRGIKKVLKETAACKLVGSGFKRRFQTPCGTRLRGVTKRLEAAIFSDGEFPAAALRSDAPAGGHWRGPGGGRKRGSAVDAQVSRLAGCTPERRAASKMLVLTRLIFAALDSRCLDPIMGQRGVCSESHKIGTAADIVCYDRNTCNLVIVELKCGHNGWRTAAATQYGECCKMKKSLRNAPDTTINRHLAQLAVTHNLFCREKQTIAKLGNLGVVGVTGLLVYANDSGVDAYDLVPWWVSKAPKVLTDMK